MLKILVISNLDAHARRANIARQFADRDTKFQFLNAISGQDVPAGLIECVDADGFLQRTGHAPSHGEIGAYASHLAASRICSAANEAVVILEDHVALTDEFAGALAICTGLIDRCGFMRLQSEASGRCRRVLRPDERFTLNIYSKVPTSLAGYVIAPRVARDLARAGRVMRTPIDVFVTNIAEHRQLIYGLAPDCVRANKKGKHPTQSTPSAPRGASRDQLTRDSAAKRPKATQRQFVRQSKVSITRSFAPGKNPEAKA